MNDAYRDYRVDPVMAEADNGGALARAPLRPLDERVPYKAVHTSQGTRTRAEPVAARVEPGKVHRVGLYPVREEQLTTCDPIISSQSFKFMDIMVYAISEQMPGTSPSRLIPHDLALPEPLSPGPLGPEPLAKRHLSNARNRRQSDPHLPPSSGIQRW